MADSKDSRIKSNTARRRVLPTRSWRVPDIFWLRQHGETLLGRQVDGTLELVTLAMLFVAAIFFAAQWELWTMIQAPFLLKVIFATGLTGLMMLLERSVIVYDKRRGGSSRIVGARLALIVVLAMIHALPLMMMAFHVEIDADLAKQALEQREPLLENARTKAHEKADAAFSRVSADKSREAQEISARRATERATLEAAVKDAEAKLSDEIQGKGSAAGAGYKGIARGLQIQVDAAKAKLADFDAVTAASIRDAAGPLDTQRAHYAQKLEDELSAIERMPSVELAQIYGGTYSAPDGLLSQLLTLYGVLVRGGPAAILLAIMLWAVMTIAELVLVFIKFNAFDAMMDAYFWLRAQLIARNDDVEESLLTAAHAGDALALEDLRFAATERPELRDDIERIEEAHAAAVARHAPPAVRRLEITPEGPVPQLAPLTNGAAPAVDLKTGRDEIPAGTFMGPEPKIAPPSSMAPPAPEPAPAVASVPVAALTEEELADDARIVKSLQNTRAETTVTNMEGAPLAGEPAPVTASAIDGVEDLPDSSLELLPADPPAPDASASTGDTLATTEASASTETKDGDDGLDHPWFIKADSGDAPELASTVRPLEAEVFWVDEPGDTLASRSLPSADPVALVVTGNGVDPVDLSTGTVPRDGGIVMPPPEPLPDLAPPAVMVVGAEPVLADPLDAPPLPSMLGSKSTPPIGEA